MTTWRTKLITSGFTIIELLVTISIIIILSAILFSVRARESEALVLQGAANTFAQTLREIQEKAMGAERADCLSPNKNPCGFGLEFKKDDDFYISFIDCANSCSSSNYKYTGPDDIYLEDVFFDSNKKVKVCSVSPSNTAIIFSPPDPTVYIDRDSWGKEASITLCLKNDESRARTVKVNSAGRIEIQ